MSSPDQPVSDTERSRPWVTYRREDGEEIFGEYSFVTEPDGLDDCDEGAWYAKETWQLVAREREWHGPAERIECPALHCGFSGFDDCELCHGEGTIEADRVAD